LWRVGSRGGTRLTCEVRSQRGHIQRGLERIGLLRNRLQCGRRSRRNWERRRWRRRDVGAEIERVLARLRIRDGGNGLRRRTLFRLRGDRRLFTFGLLLPAGY